MEMQKLWIISNFFPNIINDVEVKGTPIFEWVHTSVPKYKAEYVLKVNQALIQILGNFVYPERELMVSRLLLEEHNQDINLYFPWLKHFAHPSVVQFIDDASDPFVVPQTEFQKKKDK